jgi:glycosyltransferase involved in cell wall biosynthesis
MSDRVTWLLPVRNGMPYLPKTLASIEAQTYKNWEILVWDDGSTDGTLEELKKWIPSRLPGRILMGEPCGVGGALAKLVEACTSELCARIDADDINLPERLAKQVGYMNIHPEISVLGSWMYRMTAQESDYKHLYKVPLHHDDIVHSLLQGNSMAHPSVLFRRSIVLAVGNYHVLPNVEDYDLWLRIAKTNRYKLANLSQPLVRYRIHSKSETQIAMNEGRIMQALEECFYIHATALFGCSEREAKLLKLKQHPYAIKALYQIVEHLQKQQGGSLKERLHSDSFIQSAKTLISPSDYSSRLILANIEWRPSALPKKLLSLVEKIIIKSNLNLLS